MRSFLAPIQHLRLFASLLVLFGHTLHEATDRLTFAAPDFLDWGIGVDVFFVISGFVMYYMAADEFGRPGASAAFAVRRFQRVVPLYWVFTTLMLIAVFAVPAQIANREMGPAYVASSYAFLPWPRADGLLRPVLALGWTLNYEMFFYALFAGCLFLGRRAGMTLLVAVLVGGSALHFIVPDRAWVLSFWTDPIILEFLAGVGLAKLYLEGFRLPKLAAAGVALASVGLALALAPVEWLERAVRLGVPSALFVAAVVLGPAALPEGRASRLLSFGGDASYALYLSHPFSLNIASLIWNKLGLSGPWWFVAWACFIALIAGVAVHVGLERPLTKLVRTPLIRRVAKPA